MFEPGDRVTYTIIQYGVARATVRRIDREGMVIVWPDRWGKPGPPLAGEAVPPSSLTKVA